MESDRIEFKAGWNQDDIYHSVCAFANDYNNEGGAYILVGIEEKDGIAVRPVKRIPENMIDKIRKEMLCYNNSVSPAYFPKVVPTQIDNKWVLVIVVRTG
ncbi:MAG: ATP-binding protein [Lachnospiraceae bacterium]|nr:ATP-binding protein [Lachnospiraceae bacterium]